MVRKVWLEGMVIGVWLKALDWSEHYVAHGGGAWRHHNSPSTLNYMPFSSLFTTPPPSPAAEVSSTPLKW